MSKFIQVKGEDDEKCFVNPDNILYVRETSDPNRVEIVMGGRFFTFNESFRTVKGRIIKANGEDSQL